MESKKLTQLLEVIINKYEKKECCCSVLIDNHEYWPSSAGEIDFCNIENKEIITVTECALWTDGNYRNEVYSSDLSVSSYSIEDLCVVCSSESSIYLFIAAGVPQDKFVVLESDAKIFMQELQLYNFLPIYEDISSISHPQFYGNSIFNVLPILNRSGLHDSLHHIDKPSRNLIKAKQIETFPVIFRPPSYKNIKSNCSIACDILFERIGRIRITNTYNKQDIFVSLNQAYSIMADLYRLEYSFIPNVNLTDDDIAME